MSCMNPCFQSCPLFSLEWCKLLVYQLNKSQFTLLLKMSKNVPKDEEKEKRMETRKIERRNRRRWVGGLTVLIARLPSATRGSLRRSSTPPEHDYCTGEHATAELLILTAVLLTFLLLLVLLFQKPM